MILPNLKISTITYAFLSVFTFIEAVEILSPSFITLEKKLIYYYLNFFYFLSILAPTLYFNKKKAKKANLAMLSLRANTTIKIFLSLAVLGLLMIIFDRIFIQGVSYSEGIANARKLWQETSSNRNGVSSLFSVLGNILYPLTFMALSYSIIFYENIKESKRTIFYSICIIVIFSLVIGGRTELLSLSFLMMSSFVVRKTIGLPIFPRKFKLVFLYTAFSLLFFSTLIFYFRIDASGTSPHDYLYYLVIRHMGEPNGLKENLTTIEASLYSLTVYISHVKWIFVDITLNPEHNFGNSFFNQTAALIQSRGGIDLTAINYHIEWTHHGRWIPFIGSVYHDFGFLGVILFCTINSIVIFLSLYTLLKLRKFKENMQIYIIGLLVIVITFITSSPFSNIFTVVSFNYLFFTTIVIGFIINFIKSTKGFNT